MVDFLSTLEYIERRQECISNAIKDLKALQKDDLLISAELNTGIVNAIESLEFIFNDLQEKYNRVKELFYEEAELIASCY